MTSRPPELRLIEDSREGAGLSRLAAAKIAKISDTWWRKVETGEQILTGRRGLRTLARMADAAGVPAGAMEQAGRTSNQSWPGSGWPAHRIWRPPRRTRSGWWPRCLG